MSDPFDLLGQSGATEAADPETEERPELDLVGAVEILLHTDLIDDGVHDLVCDHDGDGWNEPFSAHYGCGCGVSCDNEPVRVAT